MKAAQVILLAVAALASALASCTPPGTPVNAAQASAADEGCVAACARIQTCAGATVAQCREDCTADLTTASSGQIYQACVEQLSCVDIQRSLVMNQGPLSRCFRSARGQ